MQNRNNDEMWIGQKFGRLTVVGFERKTGAGRGWNWIVKCDCGTTYAADPYAVKTGNTKSCGCLKNEIAGARLRKHRRKTTEYKRLYEIFSGMKKRCYSESAPRYKDYGGRGISVCEEWMNSDDGFDRFVDWALASGYSDELTIDRIDVDGNYSPENCCWLTRKQQNRNKRETLWVNYRGERVKLREICEEKRLPYGMIYNRIFNKGWDVEKAIDTPSIQENSLLSKCKKRGVNYMTIRDRLRLGWSEEEAFNTPTAGRGANRTTYGRKLHPKTCVVCGIEFVPNSEKQIYCGEKCRNTVKRVSWRREHGLKTY